MKHSKIFFFSLVLLDVLVFSFFPLTTQALVPPLVPFGGLDVAHIPCTCTGGAVHQIYFGKFSFPRPIGAGSLSWVVGTIGYAHYIPHPGAHVLGSVIPGVQMCWMYAAFFCFPLPNLGMIGPTTGTSL